MKEFLSQRGITFVEQDVAEDEAALHELTSLGFYSTPVTLVAGQPVVGFDRPRLEALLAL